MPKPDRRPVCLVTGAGRRIGAAIASGLADAFDVAVHYNASAAEAESVVATVAAAGGRARTFQADLADANAAKGLVAAVASEMGAIDLLVASASIFDYDTPSTFDAASMRRLLDVNLVAPLVLAQAFGEHGSPDAILVLMLDNKVVSLNPDFFSYTLAKVALRGAVDMLALHYRNRMRVCGIAPGVTLVSGDQSPANFEKSWRHTLTGAGPTPADIASTVRFVWQTKSLNGEIVVLDGGQHLMSLERDVAFVVE